jgi:hypothetical protein
MCGIPTKKELFNQIARSQGQGGLFPNRVVPDILGKNFNLAGQKQSPRQAAIGSRKAAQLFGKKVVVLLHRK